MVEWILVEWSGVEWSGAEWSGVERSGVEWSRDLDNGRGAGTIRTVMQSLHGGTDDGVKARTPCRALRAGALTRMIFR
jgi:hypothetical protein